MDYNIVYPQIHSKKKKEYTFRVYTFIFLLIGFISCGIVNICVKGYPWSLLVLIAEWLFWIVFIDRPLVENTLLIKIQLMITGTSVLLIAILWFLHVPELFNSIPIVLSSGQIFIGLLLLLFFKKRNKNTFKLIYVVTNFLILIASLVLSIILKNWYQFLLFGLAELILVINCILYRYEILTELKKRFSISK